MIKKMLMVLFYVDEEDNYKRTVELNRGSNIIKIEGVKRLKDVSYNIMPDRIEAGTYLIAGAMLGKSLKIQNVIITQELSNFVNGRTLLSLFLHFD